MMVLGMDIGYSNLKLVWGDHDAPKKQKTATLPAGAASLDRVNKTLVGDIPPDVVQVLVDGELWAGAISPTRLSNTVRQLHKNYIQSPAYKALFHAALVHVGQGEIDLLVTGLPVYQYFDEQKRHSLSKQLAGQHEVAPGQFVTVNKVMVMPQPAGGFFNYLANSQADQGIINGVVAIVDPGFFSFDWTIFEEGNLLESHSGSALSAVSVIIEEMQNSIIEAHPGSKVSMNHLERCLREGTMEMYLGANKIDLLPMLETVKKAVAREAFEELELAIRRSDTDISALHFVGGGAKFYLDAAGEHFPDALLSVDKDPVLANARGYWGYGVQVCK